MEHHVTPPRSRVVRVSEPAGELTMRIVAQLKETVDTQTIRGLISGDQLAVSADGLHSAHIITFRRGAEIVMHSGLGVMSPRFQRTSPHEGTRILALDGRSAIVWGKVDGYPTGLWRLDGNGGRFLSRLDKLVRSRDASHSLVRGINQERPGEHLCLTSWGELWPVHERAMVVSDQKGLSVLEELGGILYAYRIQEGDGIAPFQMLNLSDAERPIGIVSWQGRLMVAIARGSQSWLVELNLRARRETPEYIQVDGDLHGILASPGNKTLAMLVHPRGEPDDIRRLQLSDGRIVHEGRFSLDTASLTWSPNEQSLAARILEGEGHDRVLHERIVGTSIDRPIALGLQVREMLVDDRGRLVAVVQHDGMYDQPIIGGREGTKVPLAWNLHYTQEGTISWTTVHGDRILTWTQDQPTLGVVGHAMR